VELLSDRVSENDLFKDYLPKEKEGGGPHSGKKTPEGKKPCAGPPVLWDREVMRRTHRGGERREGNGAGGGKSRGGNHRTRRIISKGVSLRTACPRPKGVEDR